MDNRAFVRYALWQTAWAEQLFVKGRQPNSQRAERPAGTNMADQRGSHEVFAGPVCRALSAHCRSWRRLLSDSGDERLL
jgi:hypothetical protein